MKMDKGRKRIAKVTAEHILMVHKCQAKFPNASNREIGMFCNIGRSTVNAIKSGRYDYLIEGDQAIECALHDESARTCPFNELNECDESCAMFNEGQCMVAGASIAIMKMFGLMANRK